MSYQRARPITFAGFTLIETMVVLAIMGILAALAAPSLQTSFDRYRVNAVYDELRSTYALARSEAVRTRSQVVVARVPGVACATTQEWQCGWVIFADTNANGVQNLPLEPSVRTIAALTGGTTLMTFNTPPSRITFDRWGNVTPLGAFRQVLAPRGNSNLDGTLTLCASSGGRFRRVPGDAGVATCAAQ